MSGSFERLKYDQGTYARDLKQSTDPLRYKLDPTFANRCSPCRPDEVGYISSNGVSLNTKQNLVDIDSQLRYKYRATKDPSQKYIPNCMGETCEAQSSNELLHFPQCDIGTDYTRITNPNCTLKGTGINRFTPLYLNPQDESRWLHPGEVGINYRMVVKDNHVPCVPRPLDQSALLPKGGDLPCPPVGKICGNFVGNLHGVSI